MVVNTETSGRDVGGADDDRTDCRFRSQPTMVDHVLASRGRRVPLGSPSDADRSMIACPKGRHGQCRSS